MPTLYRLSLPFAGCLLLACGSAAPQALADDTPVAPGATEKTAETRTVYLDGPAEVEYLKIDDPEHYQEVRALLAAADFICAPGPASLLAAARYEAQCSASFLRTSNPPKRQLSFNLGNTHYIALVVLTRDQPQLTPTVR